LCLGNPLIQLGITSAEANKVSKKFPSGWSAGAKDVGGEPPFGYNNPKRVSACSTVIQDAETKLSQFLAR